MMNKIAIIGASYLQLPLVKKAKEMGLETHCFAWSEGAVCQDLSDYFYPISILDKEAIFEKCKELKIQGITTIATDIAVPTICYVAEKLGLVSNSYQSSLFSTNKGLMRERFYAANVKSPGFAVLSNEEEWTCNFDFPLIVKPVDRSGSRGVSKVNNKLELVQAVEVACNESLIKKCIVEEYIEGVEVSVESLTWKGKHHILTVTDKVTIGAPYFVEIAHHQPSLLPHNILQKIKHETSKALDALDMQYGASHAEFKITNDGEVYVIEVGVRMGGDFIGSHLVSLSTGFDYLKAVLEIALGIYKAHDVDFKDIGFSAGVYFLCKNTEQLMPYFTGANDFDVEKSIQSESLKWITNSNDRSGYLIYKSNAKISLL